MKSFLLIGLISLMILFSGCTIGEGFNPFGPSPAGPGPTGPSPDPTNVATAIPDIAPTPEPVIGKQFFVVEGEYPAVYGSKIVYAVDNTRKLMLYDYKDESEKVISIVDWGHINHPDIHENLIVWAEDGEIFFYDLENENREQITHDDTGRAYDPAIHGTTVVWSDYRSPSLPRKSDIYMYDLATFPNGTDTQITTDPENQGNSDIYDDIIVWTDWRDYYIEIYMYELPDGPEIELTPIVLSTTAPSINERNIVWTQGDGHGNMHLWLYDVDEDEKIQISTSNSYISRAVIFENRVAYFARTADDVYNIFLYDLETGDQYQITDSISSKSSLDFQGNTIVWVEEGYPDNDFQSQIYAFELVR